MLFGIDVSAAQRGIDIVKLKQLNPDLGFVGVKSTGSGGAYVNDDCDRVMQQCFSIGLPCFNYDFTEDGVPAPQPPSAYAEGIAAHITGYAGKAGVAIDWESTIASGLMGNADYAAAAVARLQQLRTSPGFYIDYRTLTNGADWSKVAATGCWKWRASYVYDTASGQTPFYGFGNPDWSLLAVTPAWPDAPAIWQYTSCGYLQGWDGKLDFNVFNGDQAGLLRLLGISTTIQPANGGNVTPIPEDDMTPEEHSALMYAAGGKNKVDFYKPDAVNAPDEYAAQQDFINRIAKAVIEYKVPRVAADGTVPDPNHPETSIEENIGWDDNGRANLAKLINGITLTLTDAQVQALADKLNATLPAATLAALKAKL